MTGTRVSCRTVSAYAELLSVPAMEALMMEAMQEAEKPEYTDDDYEYAARFAADQASPSIDTAILPADQSINLGSTDVGDVSWQVPTGLIGVTTEAAGCALHTWQVVAQGKSPLAHKWKSVAKATRRRRRNGIFRIISENPRLFNCRDESV